MRTFLVVAILPAMAGCAVASEWVRTDGGSIDQAQRQATLAQCKAEAVTAVQGDQIQVTDGSGSGLSNFLINLNPATPQAQSMISQQNRIQVIEACMARNGYILSRGN